MRCQNCDRLLSDYEATRKHAITFKFLDLCKVCFEDVKPFVPTIDRTDLITEADLDEPEDDLDTTDSLEDVETLYSYVVDSREDYDDR